MDRRGFLSALAGAALVGCGAPYTVIRLATPNPMLGRRRLSIEPVDYEGLLVQREPESAWLARRAPSQVRSYIADRASLAASFLREVDASRPPGAELVRGPVPPDALVVRPTLTYLEPGFFSHFAHENTEARMTVRVLDPSGAPYDEVQLIAWVQASQYHPSAAERMQIAGVDLGRRCAAFLRDRMHGLR